MPSAARGIDLLNQLNSGALRVAPSDYVIDIRASVSEAMEEMIEVGARIRPLLCGAEQVGWVRGVHLTERKALKRWVRDDVDFIELLILLATSLSVEYVRQMSLVEVRSLTRVIKAMTDSDLRLYPYIAPFVTTSTSEQLWFSRGTEATTFRDRVIKMPGGGEVKISLPSDQAKLWATLSSYRMAAKSRLEASTNAVLTIRPMVGKAADPIANELKALSRSLITDTIDPWRDLIRYEGKSDFNDGWAHSEDDSARPTHACKVAEPSPQVRHGPCSETYRGRHMSDERSVTEKKQAEIVAIEHAALTPFILLYDMVRAAIWVSTMTVTVVVIGISMLVYYVYTETGWLVGAGRYGVNRRAQDIDLLRSSLRNDGWEGDGLGWCQGRSKSGPVWRSKREPLWA